MRIPILNPIDPFEWAGGFSMQEFDKMLGMMSDDDKTIELYVASPGGDVAEADKIYSKLLELKDEGYTISALLAGEVASAASYIIMAAEKIEAFPHARLMIHNSWTFAEGNQHDMKEAIQHLEAIDNSMAKIYAGKTGKSEEDILEMMKNETWMSADEAVANGFVDIIKEAKKAVAYRRPQPVKNTPPKTTVNFMTDFKEVMASLKKEIKGAIKGAFRAENPKAMNVELEDGTIIFVESEDGELVGKVAYTTDEEGNPTETFAPEGTHQLQDGRSIVVGAEGVIESVEESELAKAQAQIATLQAQLTEATSAVAEATQTIVAMKRKIGTAEPAKSRTAQVAGAGKDNFDALDAFAQSKGMTRAEAERWFETRKPKNK